MEEDLMNKYYSSMFKYKDFNLIKNYFLFKLKKYHTTKTYTLANLQHEIFFLDILQEIIDHLNETILLSCRIHLVLEDRNE